MHASSGKADRIASLGNTVGTRVLAVALLSLGIGVATAAFSAIDATMPHAASYSSCDTALSFDGGQMSFVGIAGGPVLRARMGDYVSNVDAASDGLDDLSDVAMAFADRAPVFALSAAALALLVACANAARTLRSRTGHALRSSGTMRVALVAFGAISVAALMIRVASSASIADALGSIPIAHLGARAIVFALCVSALAEARHRLLPRLT